MGFYETDPVTGEEIFHPDPNMPDNWGGGEVDIDLDGDGTPDIGPNVPGIVVTDFDLSQHGLGEDGPWKPEGEFDPSAYGLGDDPNLKPESEPGSFLDLIEDAARAVDAGDGEPAAEWPNPEEDLSIN
jgi:hypothetical protein